MNQLRNLFALLIIAVLLQSGSCKKDDTSGPGLTLEQIITQGTWKVHLYSETGVDKTANYNGNTLKFVPGGTMQVVRAATTFTGSWNINATAQTLGISISTFDVQLMALNADWKVTAASETLVQLQETATQKVLHIQKL